MDMRILALLLILGVAGSLANYQDPYVRTRRDTLTEEAQSVTPVLSRVHRTVATPTEDSENSSAASTTPVSSVASSATEGTSTTRPASRTSSTPKSTRQTPAAASTPAPAAASPIESRLGEEEPPAAKPNEDNEVASSSPSKPASKPASNKPDGRPTTDSRSNFNDNEDRRSTDNSDVQTMNLPNFPMVNPIPNVPGWAQSGANSWGSASSSGYAGTGSFVLPFNGDPSFQGRSGFQVDPGFNPGYYNRGGNGFYDPNPLNDPMSATDPAAFHRMMEDYFKTLQAQLEAQHNAIWQASNFGNGFPNGNGFPTGNGFPNGNGFSNGNGFPNGNSYSNRPNTAPGGPQTSFASARIGPDGGFQSGFINPVGAGIESRFAEDVPAPSGSSYGVFSSSQSSTRIGPDGQQVSHKTSTTGVNDNGKITFRTIED